MICQTTKQGIECFFMNKSGCSYNGGTCIQIVAQCEGCEKITDFPSGKYCLAYPQPELKWKNGACNFNSHIKREVKQEKVVNALKASKRKAAGK